MGLQDISLYIHIPFCRSRCGYCAFFSCTLQDPGYQNNFVDRILVEWQQRQDLIVSSGLATVYFGGGTPSELSAPLWTRLLSGLNLLQRRPPGVDLNRWATVEANPGSLDQEKMQIWSKAGIGRISLGVQSFSEKVLADSQRESHPGEISRSVDLLKKSWKGQWSLDLICGLPGQTRTLFLDDIRQGLDTGAGHIALYEFILEEDSPMGQQLPGGLPSLEERQDWWHQAKEILNNAGLIDYETSNFAKPGWESLHNLAYWESRPWVGLGPSASSFYSKNGSWVREVNPDSLNFPPGPEVWGLREKEILTQQELLLDVLLSGLRLKKGISKQRFHDVTGLGLTRLKHLFPPRDRGYLWENDENFGLTDPGRDILDSLLARCDLKALV